MKMFAVKMEFWSDEAGTPVMTAATVILDINSEVWYSDTGW